MWTFMELKELLLLICISQSFSAQIWRVGQHLTQPASGSGITFTIRASHSQHSKLVNMYFLTFGSEWRFGEGSSNETFDWWSLTDGFKVLFYHEQKLVDSCLRFIEMVRWQMVTTETVGIWRMTCLPTLHHVTVITYHSHCHPRDALWWSSSANKS